MFREMRRSKQVLSKELTEEIMKRGTNGVLAVFGDEGYPYAVPVSYVYDDMKIWFHTAKSGHKVDALRNNPKVSFCVVDKDQIVPEKYTTFFRSAIAFGKATILESKEEKIKGITALSKKYNPTESDEGIAAAIEKEGVDAMFMVRIDIDHLSGKEAIELVRERNGEK